METVPDQGNGKCLKMLEQKEGEDENDPDKEGCWSATKKEVRGRRVLWRKGIFYLKYGQTKGRWWTS